MKTKRCTNSSCRKVFKAEALVCPHCGKKYPRATPCSRHFAVLTYTGCSKLAVIKQIRKYTGLGLRDSKMLIDNVPSLIGKALPKSQAEALCSDIRAAGGDVKLIPAVHGINGVFLLPKKVG